MSFDKLQINGNQVNSDQIIQDLSPKLPMNLFKAESPSTSETHSKCLYCDALIANELMYKHKETCENRKIACEACGETVDLDIFDFHLEMCSAQTEVQGYLPQIYYQQAYYQPYQLEDNQPQEMNEENPEDPQELQNYDSPQEEPAEGNSNEEGEENFEDEDEDEDMTYEEMIGFDPSVMTYEQLIQLDNTIIKKGLNEEEMKQFPVQVYLKEFDGLCSCSICISECESGEITRKLNCGHKFHRDCIDTWLSENITCPVCKKYLR